MAKTCTPYILKPSEIQEINLDIATRRTVVIAACLCLFRMHRTDEIGAWRERAANLDLPELLYAASQLGVRYVSGGHPFHLPQQVTTIRGRA
jgi:hypothetical protein